MVPFFARPEEGDCEAHDPDFVAHPDARRCRRVEEILRFAHRCALTYYCSIVLPAVQPLIAIAFESTNLELYEPTEAHPRGPRVSSSPASKCRA